MSSPTNLTERIAFLRGRQAQATQSAEAKPPGKPKRKPTPKAKPPKERRLASDFFLLFTYALLFFALISQLIIVASLDLF